MGESKLRSKPLGECIYCGSVDGLCDEHVLPFGLSGNLVLVKASCQECAKKTSKLEGQLLRGPWWPARRILGLRSRRSKEVVPDLPVTIRRLDGTEIVAVLPMAEQSLAFGFYFDSPSILEGKVRMDTPGAKEAYVKLLGPVPLAFKVGDDAYHRHPDDKITLPINLNAGDVCRFLAKVAHCYAIFRRGIHACSEYFLPPFILESAEGLQTYVGGASSAILGQHVPGSTHYAMLDRVSKGFLMVDIQLFRDAGETPPIYEVVVGRLAA